MGFGLNYVVETFNQCLPVIVAPHWKPSTSMMSPSIGLPSAQTEFSVGRNAGSASPKGQIAMDVGDMLETLGRQIQ